MSDQPIERRDTTVLQMLKSIQDEQLRQGKELAVNTTKTDGINVRLDKLNGSIAKHETQLQLLKETVTLNTNSVNEIKRQEERNAEKEEKADEKKGDRWRRWSDKAIWAVITFLVFALWQILKVLVEKGIIKDLIK